MKFTTKGINQAEKWLWRDKDTFDVWPCYLGVHPQKQVPVEDLSDEDLQAALAVAMEVQEPCFVYTVDETGRVDGVLTIDTGTRHTETAAIFNCHAVNDPKGDDVYYVTPNTGRGALTAYYYKQWGRFSPGDILGRI